MGMDNTKAGKEKLISFINDAFEKGKTEIMEPNKYGETTVKILSKVVEGKNYTFRVSFLTRPGEKLPECTTISVPELNKLIPLEIKKIKETNNN